MNPKSQYKNCEEMLRQSLEASVRILFCAKQITYRPQKIKGKLEGITQPRGVRCGQRNTEPGAVATGSWFSLKRLRRRQTRSLPLPVPYSSTHDVTCLVRRLVP